MQHAFPVPNTTDYNNVVALNSAFLALTTSLKSPQRGRLAAAPFLLFSVREHDEHWWRQALDPACQGDFLKETPAVAGMHALQAACIGFLWQLANRDPHAARLVSGANARWCQQMTRHPLIAVLDRVVGRNDLLLSRFASDDELLQKGVSSISKIRRASHITALQQLLTSTSIEGGVEFATAACTMRHPVKSRVSG